MRWEMRTRLFLRTAEFLWQEGHTAHADQEDAMAETMKMLEVYRTFVEEYLAMPVIDGEKPENERFPGAEHTFSIEAMMQDGKALQAGTSHYLGTHFSKAQNIRYQDKTGGESYCHTTSWGVSTRLIGGLIMTHGDDDGLRTPPAIAPKQIVLIPILRDKPEDADVLSYCDGLAAELREMSFMGRPIRTHVDKKHGRSADKRWDWVRRGPPLILEVGPRDAANGQVTVIRRDKLRDGDKIRSTPMARAEFINAAPGLLKDIQTALFTEAQQRLEQNIRTDVLTFDALAEHFGQDEGTDFKGWVAVDWAKPSEAELEAVGDRLKAMKLTLRNAPMKQPDSYGTCIFTGKPATERVLVARAY